MDKPPSKMAEQIAQVVIEFERQRTGHAPHSVTVVLSDHTLVITVHGFLSPIEKSAAKNPEGAAQLQEFHRQVFLASSEALRQKIRAITGVDVCQSTAEVDPKTGTVVQVFTTGTVVQVFLLVGNVTTDTWSSDDPKSISPPLISTK